MHRTTWEKFRDRGEDPRVFTGDDPFAHLHGSACMDTHTMTDYLFGNLSEDAEEAADLHLADCDSCAVLGLLIGNCATRPGDDP